MGKRETSEIQKALQPALFLGKILGIFPFNKKRSILSATYRGFWGAYFTAKLLFHVNILLKRTGIGGVHLVSSFMYIIGPKLTILFVFTFLSWKGRSLEKLLQRLEKLSMPMENDVNDILRVMGNLEIDEETKTDKEKRQRKQSNFKLSKDNILLSYPKFCYIAFFCILLNSIIENIYYDMNQVEVYNTSRLHHRNETNRSSALETFLERFHPELKLFGGLASTIDKVDTTLSLKLGLVVGLSIGEKFALLVWTYADILSILLSQAMTNSLRIVKEELRDILLVYRSTKLRISSLDSKIPVDDLKSSHVVFGSLTKGSIEIFWEKFYQRCMDIMDLFEDLEKFVYPLILACYWTNIFLLIDNLYRWIAPNNNYLVEEERTLYNYFAFTAYSLRVFFVTYFAAEVFHVGKLLLKNIQKFPTSWRTCQAQQLESFMISNPCSISLFGTFPVTRGYFASIISFIFTCEIVLLQTNSSDNKL